MFILTHYLEEVASACSRSSEIPEDETLYLLKRGRVSVSLVFGNAVLWPCALRQRSHQFVPCMSLGLELDVLSMGLQCWRKGDLKAMLLEYLLLGS